VAAMVDAVEKRLGPIDVYVSNVALRRPESIFEMSIDSWNEVLTTNLSAAFFLARRIVPTMVERGWGRVIHVGGADGFAGAANRAHNVAAKAGLHGFTKALAHEVGRSGVTVNSIVPGGHNTQRAAKSQFAMQQAIDAMIVGRLGEPAEFAATCAFLASDDAGNITGQALHLNGGQHMY
jgi:NAD(P)-dependent dehydrogenase (short-subunit alcohol dehydrogenase family)